MIVKTPSLVLRRLPFRESSQIATLLTRDLGRVQVLAKGIRRRRPAEAGGLDLLTFGQSLIYHKPHRLGALHILAETAPFEQWYTLRHRIDRIYAGYYIAELARWVTPEEVPDEALFRVFTHGVSLIARCHEIRPLLDWLITRVLTVLGSAPLLDACASCGRPDRAIERPRIEYTQGGLLCESCPATRAPVSVTRGGLAVLAHLQRAEREPPRIRLSEQQAVELGRVFGHVTRHLLERQMRMERLLIDGVPHLGRSGTRPTSRAARTAPSG